MDVSQFGLFNLTGRAPCIRDRAPDDPVRTDNDNATAPRARQAAPREPRPDRRTLLRFALHRGPDLVPGAGSS